MKLKKLTESLNLTAYLPFSFKNLNFLELGGLFFFLKKVVFHARVVQTLGADCYQSGNSWSKER